MGAVKLQSESVMAARFSTKEVFDLVTADDDFGVSDGDSSEDYGEDIYAYRGEYSFSSVDVESFQEVALSRPELRDASPATLCSVTWSSDEEGEQEQLIGKPNIYVGVDIGH